jgi:Amino acid permease
MSTGEIEQAARPADESGSLRRSIDWKGAFWVASGVPALVLFSIGQVAGAVGKLSFLIWSLSIMMGFIQSFTYAEIAGLFPNKSGGASIYGAAAWVRYSKVIAPLSVWCNWFAWSPVLSLGCTIAAAYVLTAVAPIHDFRDWTLFAQTIGPVTFSFKVGSPLEFTYCEKNSTRKLRSQPSFRRLHDASSHGLVAQAPKSGVHRQNNLSASGRGRRQRLQAAPG